MITPDVAHYLIAGCLILLGAGGAGIGLGLAAVGVEGSATRQQTGQLQSFNAMIIGLALIESGAIIALVMTMMTLFNRPAEFTWPKNYLGRGGYSAGHRHRRHRHQHRFKLCGKGLIAGDRSPAVVCIKNYHLHADCPVDYRGAGYLCLYRIAVDPHTH